MSLRVQIDHENTLARRREFGSQIPVVLVLSVPPLRFTTAMIQAVTAASPQSAQPNATVSSKIAAAGIGAATVGQATEQALKTGA